MSKLSNPMKASARIRIAVLIACTIGALAPWQLANAVSANIIDATYGAGAGSFELGNFVDHDPLDPGYMSIYPGGTAITGWTVGGNAGSNLDWVRPPLVVADTGSRAVDFENISTNSIFTTIPTLVNGVYSLSFSALTAGSVNATVSAGSLANQIINITDTSSTWMPFTFLFSATGSTTTITFQVNGDHSGLGPRLDSVSVSAVPIPSAIGLFYSAVTGLIGFNRRKS